MKAICRILLLIFYFALAITTVAHTQTDSTKVRIIIIGAHPDDCDMDAGGTSALFASMGYAVKFVAVTNGDAGHQSDKGVTLAKRRFAEAQEAGKRFGVSYDVLDNHDGELLPTLQVRLQIIKKIREWNADVVIALNNGQFCASFQARTGKRYVLERRADVDSGGWTEVANLPPAAADGPASLCDPAGQGNGFYRIGEQ